MLIEEKNRTSQIQSDFARFCRTGDASISIPGAGKNIRQYHELMHNIVIDTIASNFPIAKKIVKKKIWHRLLVTFIEEYNCMSPQIWRMPKEFHDYVLQTQPLLLEEYPTLRDALVFDWKETEVFMMEDQKIPPFKTKGAIHTDALVVSPEIEITHFNYPVYNKKPKKISEVDFGNYYLIFYRNIESGEVNYWEIPPAYVRLLEILSEQPHSVLEAAQQVCDEAQIVYDTDVQHKALAFAEECLERQILLGYIC